MMKSPLTYFLMLSLIGFMSFSTETSAQDDLLKILEAEMSNETEYTFATFKATRIVNAHSVDFKAKGDLEFIIQHRFGRVKSGAGELWGLDNAGIRLGLEYGLMDRMAVGVGRSSYTKSFDFYGKYKLLRQTNSGQLMPVSLVLFASTAYRTLDFPYPNFDPIGAHYFSHTFQALLARKFSSSFSLQLMPTYLHRSLVETQADQNGTYAVGLGGRMKITQRFSIVAEYFYNVDTFVSDSDDFFNPLSICMEIETGGHVFQFHLSNSEGMIEPLYLRNTQGSWGKGDVHLGFNISRVFSLQKERK